jgi:hypothetical protein
LPFGAQLLDDAVFVLRQHIRYHISMPRLRPTGSAVRRLLPVSRKIRTPAERGAYQEWSV